MSGWQKPVAPPPNAAERAREEFIAGRISAGEFERRLELAFAHEDEQVTTVIDRGPFEYPLMDRGAQEESGMEIAAKALGGVLAGIAVFFVMFLIAAIALGAAGMVVYLLSA